MRRREDLWSGQYSSGWRVGLAVPLPERRSLADAATSARNSGVARKFIELHDKLRPSSEHSTGNVGSSVRTSHALSRWQFHIDIALVISLLL
jgi:hypothetical protein